MRKKTNIRILLLSMGLVLCSSVLSGCDQEEDVAFFSESAVGQQENESAVEEIPEDTTEDISEENGKPGEILVYICGAVKEPGVIALPEGSRMNDAVLAAGGFSEDAAVIGVNLAAKLQDEQMIVVLTEEEFNAREEAKIKDAYGKEETQVNLNTADISDLCSLPGIGESKARDIITYREKNGAFRRKEDIMQVTGIKENLYRKICDLISVK